MKNYRLEFPLEYCAARFLRQWQKYEESLFIAISAAPTAEVISKALAYFQVSRTFKDLRKKPENLEKIRAALMKVRADQLLTTTSDRVTSLAHALERDFEQFNLSAASKLLWLSYREPFVVYDKRAVKALSKRFGQKFRAKNYAEYSAAWRSEYTASEKSIEAAVHNLPKGRSFMPRSSLDDAAIASLAGQSWFKERVFDIFLWEVGGDA